MQPLTNAHTSACPKCGAQTASSSKTCSSCGAVSLPSLTRLPSRCLAQPRSACPSALPSSHLPSDSISLTTHPPQTCPA
ncbi:hypothetical protein GQ607_001854 [Colletotrichum asianum]|uniref:Zinc-ribbon domain-containing protein n=1 Tax=Colletotrichum asianum TaxID=702518 RepID=A0A8H3ZYN0_9PEZI|nr:hypothetical protein GQ607_001854 [Colletotrichum asianum]